MADTDNSSYITRYNLIAQRPEYFAGDNWYNAKPLTVSFTDGHADITTTTIFTPTISGMYLLNFYGLATTAPSGADASPNLYTSWTDEHGTQTCFDFAGNLDMTYTDGPNSSTRP